MTTITKQPPHVLVFPYPAQGHTLPLLDLTHQLSLHHLTITILTTPKNLPTVSPLLSLHPQIHTLVLPFPSHPLIPAGVENVQELGNSGNLPVIAASTKLYDPIVSWFKSHTNPPVAIISDFFLGWTQHLAQHLNIPGFAFYPSGAFFAGIMNYCWANLESLKGLGVVDFVGLPRSPSFKEEHLPSSFRMYRESDPDCQLLKDCLVANKLSYGFIFNSFESLEAPIGGIPVTSSSGNVFEWLDGCPDASVLYVCFGSQKLLSKKQMEALADGLEKSMVRFIWVVKTGTAQQVEDGYGAVPDGFDERLAGRGLVIRGWAPQVKILRHRAVGGFLSHCGWNSILEGIVAGAMILAWPMEADQFIDARLVVEELGVGVAACEGAAAVPDSEELAKVIGESMSEEGTGVRMKAKELKRKAVEAVKEGGRSLNDLNGLIKELSKLKNPMKRVIGIIASTIPWKHSPSS
ncbi:UDP-GLYCOSYLTRANSFERASE 89A2 [Salix purpurea]|uniref:UDP-GLYCOSYLTRANSFERASE 89A2 n=1 Tax=Salix purpurea TaxID=77065 RepID=A0A9Q0Z241_SALPP|nr:UDP-GLYCOSYLTRANSFERASE 89A2 [Salix purpurea]